MFISNNVEEQIIMIVAPTMNHTDSSSIKYTAAY